MNRSRALLRSALAGAAMIAFTGLASTAQAQAPATADPAGAGPAVTSPAPPAPAASPPAPAAPSAAPAAGVPTDVTLDQPPAPTHRTAWPWIIIGTGIALVVTATVLEVHAVAESDRRDTAQTKLFSLPPSDPQHQPLVDEAASHDKSATSSRTAALVIGSVGFVAIAGAVVLWFVEGGSSESASAATATTAKRKLPSLMPSLAPGYAGAMLGASF